MDTCKPGFVIITENWLVCLTQVYVFLMMILIFVLVQCKRDCCLLVFTAVKKTIIQNWFTPHMCREAYWIRSLLQIVSCECTTARVGGARPSTIEAWQSFLLNIRNYLKEWLLCSCCPSLSPSLLIEPWDVEYVSAVLFCFVLDILLCCVWKNKK